MFTGLIQEVGVVKNIITHNDSAKIEINCSSSKDELKVGDSIAVNGACLTATEVTDF